MLITDDNEQKPVETAGFLVDLRAGAEAETVLGLILPFFSKNSLIRRSRSSSVKRSELAAMAPIMTMFAPFGFSCSAAISVIGTLTTRMSSRYSRSCTSELLTSSSPPGRRLLSNLSIAGAFMPMRMSIFLAQGLAISLSENFTVQLAVPPRISEP